MTATGVMQIITGWTLISAEPPNGEPGSAVWTATSFATDEVVTASFVVWTFVPSPASTPLLTAAGLLAVRRRRPRLRRP